MIQRNCNQQVMIVLMVFLCQSWRFFNSWWSLRYCWYWSFFWTQNCKRNFTRRSYDAYWTTRLFEKCSWFLSKWIACRIFLSIPVSVASAERRFSKLKLINLIFVRVCHKKIECLAILSIERKILKNIDFWKFNQWVRR